MFGLSWGQIAIIVLVGVFVLGPERIPTAVTWVLTNLRKLRTMAAGAQAELRKEIGPELDELRRQVADLQSLKEIQELRDLRDLHPKRLIGKNILGDEFSGGITGFPRAESARRERHGCGRAGRRRLVQRRGQQRQFRQPAATARRSGSRRVAPRRQQRPERQRSPAPALNGAAARRARRRCAQRPRDQRDHVVRGGRSRQNGSTPPHLPPSMTKLAAPKVVGGVAAPRRRPLPCPRASARRSTRTAPEGLSPDRRPWDQSPALSEPASNRR